MTIDEWEAGYPEACGTAVRNAIQGAVDSFPEVAERLSAQGCMCTMALSVPASIRISVGCRRTPKTRRSCISSKKGFAP